MTITYTINHEGSPYFCGYGAYLALFHKADQCHQQACIAWQEIETQQRIIVTINHVLDELATLLGRRTEYTFAGRKTAQIYVSELVVIERSNEWDEYEALAIFQKYADQKVSFTDCLSFVTMQRLSIRQVFTFDYHFSLLGFDIFRLIPSSPKIPPMLK
ncbi:MAG: PIN domain-containing protein [Methylovulum sp.]|uniref:type II toxin-antitoxin system VapC family toxin n=1 Tax=Methylovulum sp. TaxID=1916980 RepID=UPI0026398EAA|nr:PIN domain-containing protein [Methylovulum sp.]MDD2725291.1 PIN domain-containing protein [Methylovulum sp.]